MKILVIEDSPWTLDVIRELLTQAGHVALAAGAAREGVELARRERPDLILMDMTLPDLDGLEAARLLRADPLTTTIPIVAVTGRSRAADEARIRSAGCAGLIAKPIDIHTFAGQVAGFAGVQGRLDEIFARHRDSMLASLDRIRGALPDRLEEALAYAHPLAGALGTFGLERASELAQALEMQLRAGLLTAVEALLDGLRQELSRALPTSMPVALPSRGEAGVILVVEDDPAMAELVTQTLEADGFQVRSSASGAEGLRLAQELDPHLIVLDLNLPDLDGLRLCRHLRQAGNTRPVLILSAKKDTVDKIVGLEVGADDFLAKPFHPRELAARVRAMWRRAYEWSRPSEGAKTLNCGPLTLELESRRVLVQGEELDLTPQEFHILRVLAHNAGRALTRERILELAWERGEGEWNHPRTVDAHVRNLRAKLRPHGLGSLVEAVRGLGYRLGRVG